ncbi:MAG: LPS assembly protein LptD [Nitrospirota bacterium]|nr:LPS assembly protein LptD [Nitrospirota bacterium]
MDRASLLHTWLIRKGSLPLLIAICVQAFAGLSGGASAEELPKKIPVAVTADKLDYDRASDVYTAVGHVKIEQQDIRLEADRVVLNNKTGEAIAEGNVYLQDKGDVLTADRVEINVNTRSGIISRGDLFMSKDNYHLKGERIERRSETVYHVENGSFTTCDDDEWYLKAREIDVDLGRNASGSGVSFNMGGLPVLYTPYLMFPVRRQSGLLIPEIGFSSKDGFLMKNSVFWAISDYQDMTFTSDYRARTGHGTGIEYRYVNSRDSSGRAYYNYFDTFHDDTARWELQFQHREEFAEDLSLRSDVNLVSDEFYYRDLERKLSLRSLPSLDSNVFYVERWNTASLYLLGQYTTDLTQGNDKTIQKVPELRYTLYSERLAPFLYLDFTGAAANMTAREGETVRRADFQPELKTVLSAGGLSLTPRVGGRATYYDRGATTIEPTDRKYYYAAADLNARLSRVYGNDEETGIGRIRHSVEPTISYLYLPKIDKGDVPLLDSTEDVLVQNVVTLSIINRLTARYRDGAGVRTFDPLVFRLAQSYDVNEARDRAIVDARPRSEIRAELSVKTPRVLAVSANGNYNTYTDRLSSSSETVMVKGDVVQFDITHRYLREPRTAFLIGGLGFKIAKWTLSGQVWRDVENRMTTQQEYKTHYASQCWGLGLSYITKPGETQYLLVLDLKGLGAVKF